MTGAENPRAHVPGDVDARLTIAGKACGTSRNPRGTSRRRYNYQQGDVVVRVVKARFSG